MTDKFPDRNEYLGMSEAAIALGLSKYQDPRELWEVKTLRRARFHGDYVTERGNILEPMVIKLLETRHGIIVAEQQKSVVDTFRPWLRGHIDGLNHNYHYIGEGEPLENPIGTGLVEIKCPGSRMAQKFAQEGLPPEYIMQTQGYMHLLNLKWASVFYWDHDAGEIKQIDTEYDHSFMVAVLTRLDDFWKMVKDDVPPPLTTPALQVPGPSGPSVLELDEGLVADYKEALASAGTNSTELKDFEANLKKLMTEADCEKATGDGLSITWKESERRTISGKVLKDWTEALCLAITEGKLADAMVMGERFLEDEHMFTKTSKSRSFRKKVADV